ncbi:hypothetical protein R6Q57_016679 [Mikania cordata]
MDKRLVANPRLPSTDDGVVSCMNSHRVDRHVSLCLGVETDHHRKLSQTHVKIPLSDMDIFWKKLNTANPTLLEEKEIDVIGKMGLVTEEINSKPPEIKKSLIKKVLAHVFPNKSDKKCAFSSKRYTWSSNFKGTETKRARRC